MPAARIRHGDKGYDSNAIRRQVEENGTMPNIPPKANRRWKNCFSPILYRDRNAIERMFCRIRPPRHQLPRRRLHRRNRQLLVMSPDPSSAFMRKASMLASSAGAKKRQQRRLVRPVTRSAALIFGRANAIGPPL